MTHEQWVLYLYSIYPGDGFLVIVGMAVTGVWIYWLYYYLAWSEGNKEVFATVQRFGTAVKIKVLTVIAIGFLVIATIIPSRDMFLVIMGTPTIVSTLKDMGTTKKLHNISKLIDRALEQKLEETK